MKKSLYVEYIGEGESDIATFDRKNVKVKSGDVTECSERNAKNACRMYPKLFKIVDGAKKVEVKKNKEKKKPGRKPLSKKAK